MSDLIGQHLGPYRIIEQIGVGGMATVYKAFQPAMDRYVAVKVIASQFAQDPTFTQRFRREARAIAQLEHAHILPVYDYGEAGGLSYLVMRYLEAGTLEERLAQGQPSLLEVNRIIGQVGGALDYAHRVGVVHRDVKPSNVLIDAEGNTYLTDFGLAKMVGTPSHLTGVGVGIGTPTYMSPEQGQGAKVDARTDVYSLGVMLYRMVTGRVPYDAETPLAIVLKHVHEPLPLPRSIRPDLPEGVERVILRAMAKEPEDRFQTVKEMVYALDAAVRAAEAAARTEPKAQTAPMAVGARPAARAGVRWPRWPRWGWWATGGVGALAVLLLLGLALGWWGYQVALQGGQLVVIRPAPGTPTVTVTPAAGTDVPVAPFPTATLTPRPAVTLVPGSSAEQARAFGDPILAAVAGRPPDYEDDFSDPGSGWPIGSSADGSEWGYEGGDYFISLTSLYPLGPDGNRGISLSSDGALQVSDFVLEVDGKFDSGEWGWWTVGFRESQWGSYWMDFYPNGGFELHGSEPREGSSDIVTFSHYGRASAFERGFGAMNCLMIIAQGPWIAVYGNGEPLWLVYDESLSRGGVLLGVSNAAADTLRAHFDNLKVWDITDLPMPTSETTATPRPIATSIPGSPADQARAFGDPILAAIAGRSPDYVDDFSDPGSGWPIGPIATGGEKGYEDGAYYILTAQQEGVWPDHELWFSDFVLEVDAQFAAGEWGSWTTRFRCWPGTIGQPGNAEYGIAFSPDGAFGVSKNVGGVHVELVNAHAPTFEQGFDTNRLMIIAQGPQIAFYVNGEPLWFVYDESSSRGTIELGAENRIHDTLLRVHFDNFKVWDITDLPVSTPVP
jgi:predicted Ser/Thr protein kinase